MVLAKQVQIRKNDIPPGWSLEAADFINKMIHRKPGTRLGANGPEEVKAHPWFKNFPWDELLRKELISPFIPNVQLNINISAMKIIFITSEQIVMKMRKTLKQLNKMR